jgi:hypothetical protein
MRDTDAQAVLMVRALEEADTEGRVLSATQRARATQEARGLFEGTADGLARDEALLVHRACTLLPNVEAKAPGLSQLLKTGRLGTATGPLVLAGAVLLGLASNALGSTRQINILFAPMLGLVAWNLAVYGVLLFSALRRRVKNISSSRNKASAASILEVGGTRSYRAAFGVGGGFVPGLARRFVERRFRRATADRVEEKVVVAATAAGFAKSWGAVSASLMASFMTRLAHMGSLFLVMGAVAGMYVRGVGLLYRASWQSTFLDADQVSQLLNVVLGPAAALLDASIPDVGPLEFPADGDAAPWIHLWAMTGLLFIGLPRGFLWIVEHRRIHRLRTSVQLDLDQPYFRQLLSPVRGDSVAVDVLPYGVHLAPRSRDGLVELLHDVLGARAEVLVAEPLAYGEEEVRSSPDEDRSVLVLFGLGQSPESEVHGAFVRDLSLRLSGEGRLAVLIDGALYRDRVTNERRLEERRRAWNRVLKEFHVAAVHLDLDRPPSPDVVQSLGFALSPQIQQTAD